ncbi:MAG: hypothetical protein HKO62_12640 [Gammaproteobacteria bacterium]|nr:hypothetical protein [Gammaproteobacteria bacterium]NNM01593.1 hypothetical protein [Gammaproteobacteria bacterium]
MHTAQRQQDRSSRRRRGALVLALLLGALRPALATDLVLPEASGAPGETLTVALSLSDLPPGGLPLDAGLFTLDAEIAFDPGIIAISNVRDGTLAANAQPYNVSTSRPDAPASLSPLRISVIALYNGAVNESGTLFEFDVEISTLAGTGQRSDLTLTVEAVFPDQPLTLLSGGLTVIEAEPEQVPLLPLPALAVLAGLLLLRIERLGRRSRSARSG